MKSIKGITLISLVITIIVLIILSSVGIYLSLGENGIFTKAEEAKLKYEIGKTEEELDIKIGEIQLQKQGSATLQNVVDILKSEEDMDYIISLEEIVSLGEITSITEVETIGDATEIYVVYKIYQFKVNDRLETEFVSIVENNAADVTILSTLKSHDGKNTNEKFLATFEIKVESEGQVQSIEIETVDGTITEEPNGLPYTKEIQVEIGQKYIVKVTTPDGKYKKYVVEEKATDIIRTAQELATFRDKVNSGLTYAGKTVMLANDIDLSSVCYKVDGTKANDLSWEPIGNGTTKFIGTFDGNYNIIENLYINSNKYQYAGLFAYNYGKIQNLIIKNIYLNIENSSPQVYVGGIAGYGNANGYIYNCGIDSGNINGYNTKSSNFNQYYYAEVGEYWDLVMDQL